LLQALSPQKGFPLLSIISKAATIESHQKEKKPMTLPSLPWVVEED
jgi:hypothetical protein